MKFDIHCMRVGLFSYLQLVQWLQPGDNNTHLQFSQWLVYKITEEPLMLTYVATFTRCGVKNLHRRILMLQSSFEQGFSVNIWARITDIFESKKLTL